LRDKLHRVREDVVATPLQISADVVDEVQRRGFQALFEWDTRREHAIGFDPNVRGDHAVNEDTVAPALSEERRRILVECALVVSFPTSATSEPLPPRTYSPSAPFSSQALSRAVENGTPVDHASRTAVPEVYTSVVPGSRAASGATCRLTTTYSNLL
jgi:hypothetical protein